MSKLRISIVLALVLLVAASGWVWAITQYSASVSATVTIVPDAGIFAYSDPGATQPLESINFGKVRTGKTSSQVLFWVKNETGLTLRVAPPTIVTPTTIGFPFEQGTVQFTLPTPLNLAAGEIGMFKVQLLISSGATPGTLNFTITLHAETLS